MALEFAHGDLAWNAADGIGVTYTVSGLPFRPKALLFVLNGQSSAVDAVTDALNARLSIGFATSTSNRRCIAFMSVDAAPTSDCQEVYSNLGVALTISAVPAQDGQLDLNAVNNDGFQLVVDDPPPVDLRLFWYAWGGDDIQNVAIGEIAEPAAIGNQSYSVTGWLPNVGDNVVFFVGCQLTGAVPTSAAVDAGLMFGFATGIGAGNQHVIVSNEDDGSGNMDTDGYARGDECLALIAVGGAASPDARASFNGFDSLGFDLNWLERGLTNRRYIYLAIQGGSWKAGDFTLDVTTIGNTATISGLAFQPKGALHSSHRQVQDPVDTTHTDAIIGVGAWSSLTSRRAMGYQGDNGGTTADLFLGIEYDQIVVHPATGPIVYYSLDINAINSDGFQVIVDQGTGGAPQTFFEGFLAFGDAPVPHQPPVVGIGALRSAQRGFRERAANFTRLQNFQSGAVVAPAEPDTWTQPAVPGTAALRALAGQFWQRAARPLPWGDFADGPLEAQPDTYIQPIAGHAKWAADRLRMRWTRQVVSSESPESFVVVEEAPWTVDQVVGVGALRGAARLFWQRAAQPLPWGSPDDFVAPEESTWTQPAVPGVGAVRAASVQFWQRAARVLPFGDFTEGPLGEQPDTWTHEVVGVRSLRTLARGQWSRAAGLLWTFDVGELVVVEQPATWSQPVQGVHLLEQVARERWRRAVIGSSRFEGVEGFADELAEFWIQPVQGTRALRMDALARRALANLASLQAGAGGLPGGGGIGHNNLQPYIVVYIWRRMA